jgi:hypothetical protein
VSDFAPTFSRLTDAVRMRARVRAGAVRWGLDPFDDAEGSLSRKPAKELVEAEGLPPDDQLPMFYSGMSA